MKRVGCAVPAQHHTMSGGPEFQATTSLMTRAASDEEVRSALIWRKRCDVGCDAPLYFPCE